LAVSAKDWQILDSGSPRTISGRIVCLANQKGGVGKTTTAVNLGAALALRGHRVLVVDLDPQANATTGLGISRPDVVRSTYDLLLQDSELDAVVTRTRIPRLECVPATVDLAGAEIELVGIDGRERKLATALANKVGRYDLTLIDCPPSLGLLTVNALVAAHDLLVPVQCEYYALEGLGQLLATAERVRRALNSELRISGVVLTMYDARTNLAGQVADEVRSHFPNQSFATVVPRSVRLSEAPSFGEPVLTLDPSSRGSISYRLLAAEVEGRYGLILESPAPPPDSGPAPAPGPAGRGYGAVAPEPPGLDRAWPPPQPWASPSQAADTGKDER
jgi:chromosome partitioning protein